MSSDKLFSDEMLNAYLDGELDKKDRALVLEALRKDEVLSKRVCQLQKVHSMVELAYQDIPQPKTQEVNKKSRPQRAGYAIAASLLLVLGIFVGWFAHQNSTEENLLQLASQVQLNTPLANDEHWRLMLHISTDDTYRLNTVLNETERLLKNYRDNQQKVTVEILTNGNGVKLLRSDTSPFTKRIRSLQKEYNNLFFLACGQTLARLKKEKQIDVHLLPDTNVVPSAIQQVLMRQKQGWTYVRI